MMETIYRRCAGLDVHKKTVEACVRVREASGKLFTETRHFETMTRDLLALHDGLKDHGVTHVVMESTGVFWKPIYNILEGEFEVLVANARHVKQVPGRKTDVNDCQWLAQLLQFGLLRGSFIPDRGLRELRDLTRHRSQLVGEKTRPGNRWLKTLLVQIAWAASHKKGSYFQAQFGRLVRKRGKKKALVALGHSILVVIYNMLKHGTCYEDLGYKVTIEPASEAA